MKKYFTLLLVLFAFAGCFGKDEPESNKRYIENDPEACKTIRFVCNEGESAFFDDKGCGCIPLSEEFSDSENSNTGENAACPVEDAPVCGLIQVMCVTDPCDPVWESFPSRCDAENAGATEIKEGKCEDIQIPENDISAIQVFFSAKFDIPAEEVVISVTKRNDDFIRGFVAMGSDASDSGLFLAARTENGWVIPYDGNGVIVCSDIEKYAFPEDIVPECYQ